jgi:3-oxoacyl-[acyl-carrier protein] reductase
MISFQHKTVVITGATGGIGRATAQLMHASGAGIALCDLSVSSLEALRVELAATGGSGLISSHPLDVSDSTACDATLRDITAIHGPVDHLVNAAGIYPEQKVEHMTDQQWRALMSVNLDGTFYMCRAALPHLRENSSIVNLSSMAGHRGSFAHAHYAASKGGVSSLSKSLARELAPRTRVNIVAPGIIATPMIEQLVREKGAALIGDTPMKRYGTARELAGVIAFLCSELASFVNGETVHVNGGLYIV